ncbi:MAG: hypothetical protein A2Z96_02880 [Spirochaetes bacterium GWB1_48_6]|nr:MAG: hypothetical protein A2Z96_02880 [Spirochaetes bacterium GWB1_48_6]
MDSISEKKPTIIIPYSGACREAECSDYFLYLRPETNGVRVESAILRVIESNPDFKSHITLEYLANFPGNFILHNHVIEEHYRVRLHFASHGKAGFTQGMINHFEYYYRVKFAEAKILGAFEALAELEISEEELFNLWVPPYDILISCGQIIKRKDDKFIVNYDIPALLHKNNHKTDIAVMILRTDLSNQAFYKFLDQVKEALMSSMILDPSKPFSRIFHYSKGPFEQLLDAQGYLYNPAFEKIPLEDFSFGCYLQNQGLSPSRMLEILDNPIFRFPTAKGELEENIIEATQGFTYGEALNKLRTAVGQVFLK